MGSSRCGKRGLGDGSRRVVKFQTGVLKLIKGDKFPGRRDGNQEFFQTATFYLHSVPEPINSVRQTPPVGTWTGLSATTNTASGIPNQRSNHLRQPPPSWSIWRRYYVEQNGRWLRLNLLTDEQQREPKTKMGKLQNTNSKFYLGYVSIVVIM